MEMLLVAAPIIVAVLIMPARLQMVAVARFDLTILMI